MLAGGPSDFGSHLSGQVPHRPSRGLSARVIVMGRGRVLLGVDASQPVVAAAEMGVVRQVRPSRRCRTRSNRTTRSGRAAVARPPPEPGWAANLHLSPSSFSCLSLCACVCDGRVCVRNAPWAASWSALSIIPSPKMSGTVVEQYNAMPSFLTAGERCLLDISFGSSSKRGEGGGDRARAGSGA